jgi:hypothetical protein
MRPPIPNLRGLIIGGAGLLTIIFVLVFVVRVTRMEAGHAGVQINLAGSQRGASEIPIRTGWVVYSPLSSQIIEFPTWADRGIDKRRHPRPSGQRGHGF